MATHIPVLVKEVVEALDVQPYGRFIDCTVGNGGHAAAILDRAVPAGTLLGIDADPEAIKVARARLEPYGNAVYLVNDNFANLNTIYHNFNRESTLWPIPGPTPSIPAIELRVNGILFDLGLSSLQLEDGDRGFSFQQDGPLDMRFGPEQKLTAAEIVNTYPEFRIAQIIWMYGEETHSRRIARQIVQSRPLSTTLELARAVEKAMGGERGRIHPATRTFQALRIAVNQELVNLESALKQAVGLLEMGGRLAVISYHSLEDRIVKQFMQRETTDCVCPPETPTCICGHKARMSLYNKKIITPGEAEIKANPRSRSAKLRVAERVRDARITRAWV
jgi:16S rRNA (cytosine1402-N4)-methyltransferase